MFLILLLINDKQAARYSSRYLFKSCVSKSDCFKIYHAAQVVLPCWDYNTWWAISTGCAGLGSCQIFCILTGGRKWASRKCRSGHSSLRGNPCELPLYRHITVESWGLQEPVLPSASCETVLGIAFPLCSPRYPRVPQSYENFRVQLRSLDISETTM